MVVDQRTARPGWGTASGTRCHDLGRRDGGGAAPTAPPPRTDDDGGVRGGRPAALRDPRPAPGARPRRRARRRGRRPGRVSARRSDRGRGSTASTSGLALHDRPAPGVQPSARPAALARGDRAGRAAAVERPVRPGPVGGPRDARRRGRGRRCCSTCSTATPRPRSARCWACRRGRSRAGSRAGERPCAGSSIRTARGRSSFAGRRPAGGQSACRVARLAHHEPPDRGDRATTLIIAPRNDPDDMPQFGRSPGPILATPRQDGPSRRTGRPPDRTTQDRLRSAPSPRAVGERGDGQPPERRAVEGTADEAGRSAPGGRPRSAVRGASRRAGLAHVLATLEVDLEGLDQLRVPSGASARIAPELAVDGRVQQRVIDGDQLLEGELVRARRSSRAGRSGGPSGATASAGPSWPRCPRPRGPGRRRPPPSRARGGRRDAAAACRPAGHDALAEDDHEAAPDHDLGQRERGGRPARPGRPAETATQRMERRPRSRHPCRRADPRRRRPGTGRPDRGRIGRPSVGAGPRPRGSAGAVLRMSSSRARRISASWATVSRSTALYPSATAPTSEVDAAQQGLADVLQHGPVGRRMGPRGLPDQPGRGGEPLEEPLGGDAVTGGLGPGDAHDRAALGRARAGRAAAGASARRPGGRPRASRRRPRRRPPRGCADVPGDGRHDPVSRFEHPWLVDHGRLHPRRSHRPIRPPRAATRIPLSRPRAAARRTASRTGRSRSRAGRAAPRACPARRSGRGP